MPARLDVDATQLEARTFDVLTTQARIDAIILAAEAWCTQNGGTFPLNSDLLLKSNAFWSTAGKRCGVSSDDFLDAWERPIFYGVQSGAVVIRSAGIDGRFATPDDIAAPQESDDYSEPFDLQRECT